MDPLPGTVVLNDDAGCIASHPARYKSAKFLGKRHILNVIDATDQSTSDFEWSQLLDYKNPPYWNPINEPWAPEEVYVLEITMPDAHPYSKKIVYYDHDVYSHVMCDMYDKKGELWVHMMPTIMANNVMDNGFLSPVGSWVQGIDFQNMKSTFIVVPYNNQNPKNVTSNLWVPESLSRADDFTVDAMRRKYGPSNHKAPDGYVEPDLSVVEDLHAQ
jgi:hypothetical protein